MTKSISKKIEKKAADFHGKKQATGARPLKGYKVPEGVVELGEIVAIEYASKKIDGKERVYRHEVTKERKLYMSPDGMTIIVMPGFKLTKRGIEG